MTAALTSHICSWKRRRSFSISSAISPPLNSVRIIPYCLACSRFSFSIFVLPGPGVRGRGSTSGHQVLIMSLWISQFGLVILPGLLKRLLQILKAEVT